MDSNNYYCFFTRLNCFPIKILIQSELISLITAPSTTSFDFTKYDYLLIEVGISEKNDIDKHIELYTSYISCFTELDYVHTEALENLDGICYEKSKLVNNSKYKLIKNNDIIKFRNNIV